LSLLPAAFLLLLAASPQTTSPYREAMDVELHNIDVVVVDEKGDPVQGLTAADFLLLEDGKPQTITNFSEFRATAGEASGDATTTGEAAATPAIEAPPPRTFVFFVDDVGFNPSTVASLRKSMQAFLDSMREGDRGAVVRPGSTVEGSLTLTTDRAQLASDLLAVIEASDSTKRGRTETELDYYMFEKELSLKHDPRMPETGFDRIVQRASVRARNRVLQRIGALRGIIGAMPDDEGRRFLIAITQALPAVPGREFATGARWREQQLSMEDPATALGGILRLQAGMEALPKSLLSETDVRRDRIFYDFTRALQDLGRLASSRRVTIYAIRPAAPLSRDAMPDYTTDQEMRVSVPTTDLGVTFAASLSGNTTAAVRPLVDISGGRQFEFKDLNRMAQQMASDASSYYSLAYHGQGALDVTHKVSVKVRNRPELQIRARSEVERKSPRREMQDEVVAALLHDPMANDLGVRMTTVAKNHQILNVEIQIPIGSLEFEKTGAVYRSEYDVHFAVSAGVEGLTSGMDTAMKIEIPESDWPAAREKHWTHQLSFRLPRSDYRVAAAIVDTRSGRSGIVATTVRAESH
jgi:VWFA-related protein